MGHTSVLDYDVTHETVLGRGRFSMVKLVYCRRHRRHLAAKIIPLAREDDETLATNYHEILVLSKLDHVNIVDVYDHFVCEGALWIIMEHAQYGDLRKFVHKRRRLGEKSSRKFFAQILDGLAYMHSQDIVHRDIKCENILVVSEKLVKICDFGCAVSLSELSSTDLSQHQRRFHGSPAYSAPEVLDRSTREFKPTDVWSAGVVLFFMLTGYLPFGCDHVSNVRARMESPLRWPRPLKQIDKHCRAYTESILRLKPGDRPTASDGRRAEWIQS